jgi:hypothetical protein
MRKWIPATLLSAGLTILAIQIVQPARTNPPEQPGHRLDAVAPVDPAAAGLLNRSCTDCHSHATVWPWYSRVAPISWLVVSDVNRGRRAMNLSEWAGYSAEQKGELQHDICEEARTGEMAPSIYRLAHRNARLNETDRRRLCQWADSTAGRPSAASGD